MVDSILSSYYPIRFSDCDPFGHLNNASYLNYFINARIDQVNDAYKEYMEPIFESKRGWVVAKHEISYLVPVFPYEKVCIKSLLLNYSIDKLFVEMTMWDENCQRIKAVLWSTFVHISLSTGKREEHSPHFLQFLKKVHVKEINSDKGFEYRVSELKTY